VEGAHWSKSMNVRTIKIKKSGTQELRKAQEIFDGNYK
jgi:hypothetical protein